MAQQEDGWPLGLRLLNGRVGLLGNRDFSGSISFNTLLTTSHTSFTDSSDLDSQSTGSFFHDKSISLGNLIGVSTIMELSNRSSRGRPTMCNITENRKSSNNSFKFKSSWLFSLCCNLDTDAVSARNAPSLAQFLRAERKRTTAIAAAATTTPAPRGNL